MIKTLYSRASKLDTFLFYRFIFLCFLSRILMNLFLCLPILYIVFLSSIIFLIFCTFRYQKETKFYQKLKDEEDFFDSSTLSHPLRPFEKIVQRNLMHQLEQAKKDGNANTAARDAGKR